jgi:hypothetical protein
MRLFIFLLFCLPLFAAAQPVVATDPIPRVVFPRTNVGSVTTFGPMTADAANAAKFSFGAAANGAVFANTGTALATAGGASIELQVAGTIAKANVAKTIGRFVLRNLPLLNTGVALYDLAKELNVDAATTVDPQGSAVPRFTKNTDGRLYSSTSPYWNVVDVGSASGACAAGVNPPSVTSTFLDGDYCYIRSGTGPIGNGYLVFSRLGGATSRIISAQEFTDMVANLSGWPSTSALARTVVDALKSGETAQVDPVTVTGPATSPGTSSVTNTANDPATNPSTNPANNPNTSTRTETVTNTHTYAGNTVTNQTTTNITTINNSTGATTSSTTTTTSPVTPNAPVPAGEIITCGLPSTPPCKIDEAGTKSDAGVAFDRSKADIDTQKEAAKTAIDSAAQIVAPAWTFSFALPSGCSPYATGIKGVIIDICQYQGTIHDLMSMVWAAATAFCLMGMVGRTIRES